MFTKESMSTLYWRLQHFWLYYVINLVAYIFLPSSLHHLLCKINAVVVTFYSMYEQYIRLYYGLSGLYTGDKRTCSAIYDAWSLTSTKSTVLLTHFNIYYRMIHTSANCILLLLVVFVIKSLNLERVCE